MPGGYEVRVTRLDAFRIWRETEELDMDWLLAHILEEKEPPTQEMLAGTALHKAFQFLRGFEAPDQEVSSIEQDDFRFDFNCDCKLVLPELREQEFARLYDNVLVTGHVDGLLKNGTVVDYKTTGQFDPTRYMESYQWRFYLDLSGADVFLYQIFVMRPFGPPGCYDIWETHLLKQFRYPELHDDCMQLVRDYRDTILAHQNLMST